MVKSMNCWQFGDFQTPDNLAQKVVKTLKQSHHLNPDVILEPSCGKGSFIRSALGAFENCTILGFDINKDYVLEAKTSVSQSIHSRNISIQVSNFFTMDWRKVMIENPGYILIIGNPPWVTSSELSLLNSSNLPSKSNFQSRRGIEAITGSANFDISEWMLLQYIDWLSERDGAIAVLCKYSVARKVLRQVRSNYHYRSLFFYAHIYRINAKAYFGASVEACLFILIKTDHGNTDCRIYKDLEEATPSYVVAERNGYIVRNISLYEKWEHLGGKELKYIWRSGVKHDCSKVMELEPFDGQYKNGFGKIVSLEDHCIFPLLKSSDVGNKRIHAYRKVILMTQRSVGEDTSRIQEKAPKTWQYLLEHQDHLAMRKSSIYKDKPAYSIFGIGPYTFMPWKIAISGLYKKLNFCLVGPLSGKPVIFDDTVNFLSFETKSEALFILHLITSDPALEFFESMIFWDEKRPITTDILRRLSLQKVAQELGELEHYLRWAEMSRSGSDGQMELGLAEESACSS